MGKISTSWKLGFWGFRKIANSVLNNGKSATPPLFKRPVVVVLKNCQPEICHIVAELFSKCVKEPCFPDCWKVFYASQFRKTHIDSLWFRMSCLTCLVFSCVLFFLRLMSETPRKYNRSIVILQRTLLWIFGKWAFCNAVHFPAN